MNSFSIFTIVLAAASLLLVSLAASPLPEGAALLLIVEQGVLVGAYVHSETYDYGEHTLGALTPSVDFGGWAPAVAETLANPLRTTDTRSPSEDTPTQHREDPTLAKQTILHDHPAHTHAAPTVQTSSSTPNDSLATRSFADATTTRSFADATTTKTFSEPNYVPIATQARSHSIIGTFFKNFLPGYLYAYLKALILVRVFTLFYTDSARISKQFYSTLLTTNPVINLGNFLLPDLCEFYSTAIYVLTFGFYFKLSFLQCSWLLITVFVMVVIPFLALVPRHERVRPTNPKSNTKMPTMETATSGWLGNISVEELDGKAFNTPVDCTKYQVEEPEDSTQQATPDQPTLYDDIYIEVLEEDDEDDEEYELLDLRDHAKLNFDIMLDTSVLDADDDLHDNGIVAISNWDNNNPDVLHQVEYMQHSSNDDENDIGPDDQYREAWISEVEESKFELDAGSGNRMDVEDTESTLEPDGAELLQSHCIQASPIRINPRCILGYVDPDMFVEDMLDRDSDEDTPRSASSLSSSEFSDNDNPYSSRYGDAYLFAEDFLDNDEEGHTAHPPAVPLNSPILPFTDPIQEQGQPDNYENYDHQVLEAQTQIVQPAEPQCTLVDAPSREHTPSPASPTPSDDFWAPSSRSDFVGFNERVEYYLEPLAGVFDDDDDGPHGDYETPSPPPTATCPDLDLLPRKRPASNIDCRPHKKQKTNPADCDTTLVNNSPSNRLTRRRQCKANKVRLTKRVMPNPEAPGQCIDVADIIESELATQTLPRENLLYLFFPNLINDKKSSGSSNLPYGIEPNIYERDIFVLFEEDP